MYYKGYDTSAWHYRPMRKQFKVNVEEILDDSEVAGYRPDGFRILARMIARRHMEKMRQSQSTTGGDTSNSEEINETRLDNKGG
jgi:hypothetical protein